MITFPASEPATLLVTGGAGYIGANTCVALQQAGYRLVDSWDVEDLDCLIPFHPERFLRFFSGYLFERID